MKKDKKLKILFLDILTDDRKLKSEIEKKVYNGKTYASAMQKAFGLDKGQFITVYPAFDKLPDPSDYSAIVMGGSTKDPVVGQEKPWMKRVYKFILNASKKEVPILGICGGLQFTVRAMGGKIVYNPKGRNFGNSAVKLTDAGMKDPLFKGLGRGFIVQSSHKCIAAGLKPGWKLLGSSEKSPLDIIAIGKNIRLVQFHPEMRAVNARALAKMRKEPLIKEGFVSEKTFPSLLRSFKDTGKTGKKLLKNFLSFYVTD